MQSRHSYELDHFYCASDVYLSVSRPDVSDTQFVLTVTKSRQHRSGDRIVAGFDGATTGLLKLEELL